MTNGSRGRRWAALSIVALYAAAALPGALVRSGAALRDAVVRRGESRSAAWQRVVGADYAAGIEAARAAIPSDGEYLLFDAGALEQGAANWVRYDLAPRRAVRGGPVARLGRPERVRERLRRDPEICVVARPGAGALVMRREEFLSWLASGAGGG
jgi:hypothetical protein